MNIKMSIFILENQEEIEIKPLEHDDTFLLLMNVDFKKGFELCAKYGASGSSCGGSKEHFQIGNFGKYYKLNG